MNCEIPYQTCIIIKCFLLIFFAIAYWQLECLSLKVTILPPSIQKIFVKWMLSTEIFTSRTTNSMVWCAWAPLKMTLAHLVRQRKRCLSNRRGFNIRGYFTIPWATRIQQPIFLISGTYFIGVLLEWMNCISIHLCLKGNLSLAYTSGIAWIISGKAKITLSIWNKARSKW